MKYLNIFIISLIFLLGSMACTKQRGSGLAEAPGQELQTMLSVTSKTQMKLFQATNLCKYISSAEVVEKISQEDQVHLIYSRVTYHHDKYKMLKKEMSQQKAFDQFKNDIETALKELYIINNVLTAFEKAPDNNYISLLNGALLETNEAIDRLKTIEDFTHYQTNVNMCQNILDAYKNTTMLRAELQNELGIDKPVEVLIMNEGVIDSNTPANRLGNEDNYTY